MCQRVAAPDMHTHAHNSNTSGAVSNLQCRGMDLSDNLTQKRKGWMCLRRQYFSFILNILSAKMAPHHMVQCHLTLLINGTILFIHQWWMSLLDTFHFQQTKVNAINYKVLKFSCSQNVTQYLVDVLSYLIKRLAWRLQCFNSVFINKQLPHMVLQTVQVNTPCP